MSGPRQPSVSEMGPPRRRRRSKGSSRGAPRKILRLWIVTVVGLAGVTLSCLLLWTLMRQKLAPGPGIPQSVRDREMASIPTLASEHAIHLTKTLLNAKTPEEIRGVIRSGAITAPEAIEILTSMREEMGKPTPPTWIGSANAFAGPIELLYCRFGDIRHYIIPLTPDETGRWQIDFDAMVRHCDPSFELLAEGEVDRGLVRAVVKESDYFNGPYSSDTEWRSFSISSSSPELPQLYGYFKRGSKVELVMEQILTRYRSQMNDAGIDAPVNSAGGPTDGTRTAVKPDMRLTLRIHRPAGAQKNQFRIDEIVSDEWVIGKSSVQNLLSDGNGGESQAN